MSELVSSEVHELMTGARRMANALSQMDENKINELQKTVAALMAEYKKAATELHEIRGSIEIESKKRKEAESADIKAHNESMQLRQKEKSEKIKAMDIEVSAISKALAFAKEEHAAAIAKMREEAAKVQAQISRETKNLEDALKRLKDRISNA